MIGLQRRTLLRVQSLEKTVAEMMQMLRSLTSVSRAAGEELEGVLPSPINTPEELGMLCEKLADPTFKKQLVYMLILRKSILILS